MTREESIDRLRKISEKTPIRTNGDDLVAITMAIQALSQEPCDEKKDCSTCKYEECSSNNQPCRDCGTLLESYTNWEQKERELPCIYDLKNRYCPRLNEHGMLKYPLQEPCDDAISREAVLEATHHCGDLQEVRGVVQQLPPITQKCEKCAMNGSGSKYCDNCKPSRHKRQEHEYQIALAYNKGVGGSKYEHGRLVLGVDNEPQESEDKE